LSFAVLVLVGTVASATPITYDFTGVIDAKGGSFVSIPSHSIVNGTFSIDFDAATISGGATDSRSSQRTAITAPIRINESCASISY
jgi:hypothetical protein